MQQLFDHPQSARSNQDLAGLKMKDIYEIVVEKLEYFNNESDPDAFCQDMCCLIEKKLGIYPNIPGLKVVD